MVSRGGVAIPEAVPRFSPAEMEALRPRESLDLMAWTTRHIRLTEGPMIPPGSDQTIPYSPDVFPLQRAVLEAVNDATWHRVYMQAPPQRFGKTQVMLPILLHAIHHRRSPCMYVAAKHDLGVRQWTRKIWPAIRADRQAGGMIELLYENPDHAGNKYERKFRNDTSMHFAGGESTAALSGATVPVVICDDVHAMPENLPGFGHPVDIAFERAGSFPQEMKLLLAAGQCGTVDGYLWRSIKAGAYFCPFVPCCGCGTYQLLEWDRLVYPTDSIEATTAGAWMRCADAACEHRITFEELPAMLAEHLWVSCPPETDWVCNPPEGGTTIDRHTASIYPETDRNTNVASFWANGLYWPLGETWGELAAQFLGCSGDPDKVKNFQQSVWCVPWKEPEVDEEVLTLAEVERHVSAGYRAGTACERADVATCTVDVQSGYAYWLLRAWCRTTGESWLVDLGTEGKPLRGKDDERTQRQRRTLGINAALDAVDARVRAGIPVVDAEGRETGRTLPVGLALIDRGFEPDVIASWWVAKGRGRWRMIRGQKAGKSGSIWPIKPRTDKRGRPWREVDVNAAKHVLRKLLRVGAEEDGYWHMPAEGLHPNTVRAYARHMTSERFNRELRVPRWEPVAPGVANHWWDCETYQVSAAIACGVRLVGFERPAAPVKRAPPVERERSPRPIRRRY